MAQNDLIAASLEWRDLTPVLALTFEGMATGGVLTPGFAAYETPIGTTLITLTLDYEGFSDGTVTTHNKTIYPTKTKRVRFNGTDTPDDISISGSDIVVRFAMDNYFYAGCTNAVVNVSSGVYTESGTPNNSAVGFPVTNNVTGVPYPTIKANYTVPVSGLTTLFNPYTLTKDTSGNFEVRIYADNNEFVDCVKITATGVSSAVTQTITAVKQVDENDTYNDALPFPEYIATIPYGVYTQGETINITPVVYPKIGDTPFDFSALGNSMPTAKPCQQTILCDKDGSYGYSVAVVATTGNDGTGVVVDFDSFSAGSPPSAFLTRGAAYQAIYAYNTGNHSRTDDAGGGVVYMQAGSYDLQGQSQANRNNTSNMVTAPFPGVDRDQVEFVSNGFDYRGPDTYDMMSNITINMPGLGPAYTYSDNLIFYNCEISISDLFYTAASPGALNIIGGLITRIDQGLEPAAGSAYSLRLRGITCTHNTTGEAIAAEITVGCNFDDVTMTVEDEHGVFQIEGGIFCYNRLVGSTDRRFISMSEPTQNGWAINNNILINQGDIFSFGEPTVFIAADNSIVDEVSDFMICNNTIGGQRCNLFYNDFNLAGVGPGLRLLVRFQNNIITNMNFITDVDEHGGGALDATDGDRYGNHALIHGTWCSGNYGSGMDTNTLPAEGGAKNRYVRYDWEYVGFIDDQVGHPGPIIGSGDGDYHLTESSEAIDWPIENIVDYDLDGNIRGLPASAGAYAYYTDTPTPPGPDPTPTPTPTPTPEPEVSSEVYFTAACIVNSSGEEVEW